MASPSSSSGPPGRMPVPPIPVSDNPNTMAQGSHANQRSSDTSRDPAISSDQPSLEELKNSMRAILQQELQVDHSNAMDPNFMRRLAHAADPASTYSDALGSLLLRRVERAAGATLNIEDAAGYLDPDVDTIESGDQDASRHAQNSGFDELHNALKAILDQEMGPYSPGGPEPEQCKCFRHIRPHYQMEPPDEATNKAWASCAKRLKEHDETVARTWKEEIDTLLVFSGLFSAILTAFNVGFYTSLTPTLNPDLNTLILLQISGQLTNLTSSSSSAPSFLSALSASTIDSSPSTASNWINVLWFCSLALSLSTACVGIVVRQWLNHFVSLSVTEPKEGAFIHRLRWDEGIVPWRVPEIMSALPILLQLSLILFLAGLLILLATLNTVVACIVAGIVAILLLFLAFTTVAPAFQPKCPYKSPQALVFYWVAQRIASVVLLRKFADVLGTPFGGFMGSPIKRATQSRALPSHHSTDNLSKAPSWGPLRKIASCFASLMETTPGEKYWTWRAQEQSIVGKELNVRSQAWLQSWQTNRTEARLLLAADSLLTDDSFLREVVEPCILKSAYNAKDVIDNIALIIENRPLSYNATMAITLGSMKLIPRILAIENPELAQEIATKFIRTLGPHIAAFQTTPTNQAAFIIGYARLCSDIFPIDLRIEIAEQLVKIQSAAFGWRKPIPPDEPPVPHANTHFFAFWAVEKVLDALQTGDWSTAFYTTSVVMFLACLSPSACYKKHLKFLVRGLINHCMRFRATWIREAQVSNASADATSPPGRCFIEDVLTLIECHEHGTELLEWKEETRDDPWFADPALKNMDFALVDSNERDFH